MKRITVSAPGKLMLLGDHAVVYQRPCLVTAVDQRMFVTVELINKPEFQLHAPDLLPDDYKKPLTQIGSGTIPKGVAYCEVAVSLFIQKFGLPSGIRVSSQANFSSLLGLGSSSAITVCILKALCSIFGIKITNKELFILCYQTVLAVAGVGSGFDVAAGIYGGVIFFVGGGKEITPLSVVSLPLLVGYTGIKADTPTIVRSVSEKMKQFPKLINGLFTVSDLVVTRGQNALIEHDLQTFGEMMNINEGLLASLGVESEQLSILIQAARMAGAYGAKLSGAGMGDCMITIAPPDRVRQVKQSIALHGRLITVSCNAEGVKLEAQ